MKKLITTTALISTLGFAGITHAADGSGTAAVNLLAALTIDNPVDVDFASQENIDGTCSMATDGTITGANCGGTGAVGSFDVTGTSGETVQITLSADAAVNNVTFDPLLVSNSTLTDTATLTAGPDTIDVHGSITIAGATAGATALTYSVNVIYQ